MYRNTAYVNCLVNPSLPSPEHTSDSESDIIDALGRKRRQLDEEIINFKAIKDREFREFENHLRNTRRRSRSTSNPSDSTPTRQTSTSSTNSVLNLLASHHNNFLPTSPGCRAKRPTEHGSDRISKSAPSSKPTLSLERLTITGETTPQTHHSYGSPPTTPSTFVRNASKSSSNLSPNKVVHNSICDSPAPPTPVNDRFDPFTGVFTPAYLPLLDTREHAPTVRSPRSSNSSEEVKNQTKINEKSKRVSKRPSSHSLPQESITSTLVAVKKPRSTPQSPSTSLPSALRTNSGSSAKKTKHVLFQLPDSAIVDPSSSYEEGPSPDFRSEEDVILGTPDQIVNSKTPTSKKRDQSSGLQNEEKSKNLSPVSANQRGRRLRSPAVSPLPSPMPSPVILGSLASPAESGFSGGLVASEDGGSGVGFFELDEELASPAFTEDRSFDLKVAMEDEDKLNDLDEKKVDLHADNGEMEVGSFTAGSVPINIIRPITSSWVGSYGH